MRKENHGLNNKMYKPMKNKLLLSLLLLPFLLAGCQPNDDVDFPEPKPQKPVSELIKGDWDQYAITNIDDNGTKTTKYTQYEKYSLSNGGITVSYGSDAENTSITRGDYTLSESGGKNYIEVLLDNVEGYTKYELVSITDSTMIWEMNDSLAQYANYHEGHYLLHFRTTKTSPKYLLPGNWNANKATKVTYDASGNIVSSEDVAKEFNAVQFIGESEVFINWNNGNNNSGYFYRWEQDAENATLDIREHANSATALLVDIRDISDSRMTWERKESAIVSYVTEFTKVDKPAAADNSVAAKIIGEWIKKSATFPEGLFYTLDGNSLGVTLNQSKVDGGMYAVIERGGKAYLSYQDDDLTWHSYEITNVSDSSMTWIGASEPFLPDSDNKPGTVELTRSE